MANLSFTTQGAFPSVGGMFAQPAANALQASTPAGKALNGGMSVYRPTAPPPPTPAPTTPVKSTTVNNADGSSHTTTYHAPDKQPNAAATVPTSQGSTDPRFTGVSAANQTYTGADGNTYNEGGGQAPTAGPNTFPGLIGGLSTASTNGSPVAQGLIGKTAEYGAGNLGIGDSAAKIAADYGKSIADVGGEGARFEAGQLTTGTSPVAEGNAAVTAQTTAAEQEALAKGEEAALQGTAQQLTGQGQAATAANAAAGQAQTGQGLIQSGLTSAGTLAKPELGSIGQVPFSPVNQDQGTVLGSTQPGGLDAAGNLLGKFQGAQALGAASGTGAAQGEQALAAAGGTGTAGVLQTIPGLQAASTAAEGISNTIQSYLQQNPTLNANTATVANLAQQWAQGKQLGNPAYQTLFNDLSEYANTLAPVLGVGGDPTNMKTQIAQSFINAQANGQSISQVLQNMNSLARNKITDIQSGAKGGGTTVPAPNNNQNASSDIFNW